MSKKTCMPAMAMMAAPMLGWGMMKMMRSAMAGQGTDWSCEQTPGTSAWEPEGEGETGNARDASAAPEAPQQDLVDIAAGVDSFSTLVKALAAADLVDLLKTEGPFTVFAPTDEAFAALPEGALEDLLKPENKDSLKDVLTYHVVPGRLFAADLIQQQSATAANGKDVQIGLKINQATLKQADITAANGVIHVIDSVLSPA